MKLNLFIIDIIIYLCFQQPVVKFIIKHFTFVLQTEDINIEIFIQVLGGEEHLS